MKPFYEPESLLLLSILIENAEGQSSQRGEKQRITNVLTNEEVFKGGTRSKPSKKI